MVQQIRYQQRYPVLVSLLLMALLAGCTGHMRSSSGNTVMHATKISLFSNEPLDENENSSSIDLVPFPKVPGHFRFTGDTAEVQLSLPLTTPEGLLFDKDTTPYKNQINEWKYTKTEDGYILHTSGKTNAVIGTLQLQGIADINDASAGRQLRIYFDFSSYELLNADGTPVPNTWHLIIEP